MSARLVEVNGSQVKIEMTVELSRSMLDTEEAIQVALNEAGCIASREALRYFDTDGSPIKMGVTSFPSLKRPSARPLNRADVLVPEGTAEPFPGRCNTA